MNLNMDSPMDQTYYYDPQYLPPDQCPAAQPPAPSSHQICHPPMHYMPAGGSAMPSNTMTPASHPLPAHTHPGPNYDMGHMTALGQSPTPMLHSPPQHAAQSSQASSIGSQVPLSHDISGQMSAHYKTPSRHFDSSPYLSHPHSQSIGSPHQVYPHYNNNNNNTNNSNSSNNNTINNNGPSKNKYITTACPLSSGSDGSLNISGTITHVSETDHSREHIPSQHNLYPSTPAPLTGKPILNHTTSTPINYPPMPPNSNHNWNGRLAASQSIASHRGAGGALVGQPSPNQTPIYENGKMSAHYTQYTNIPRNNVNNISVNNINNDVLSSSNNNNNAGLDAYQNRQAGSASTPLSSIGSQAVSKETKNRLEKRFAAAASTTPHDKSLSELSNNNTRKSCLNPNSGSDNAAGHIVGCHNKPTVEINPKKSDGISLLSHTATNNIHTKASSDRNNNHNNIHNNNNNNSNDNRNYNKALTTPDGNNNVQLHNGMLVEKRQITLFKVIEQFIHPVTRAVLKENIVQNVELTTPCGRINYDGDCSLSNSAHNTNSSRTETSLFTNGTHPADNSSAMFADVSGLSSRNKSKLQISENNSTGNKDSGSNIKAEPTSSSDDNKTVQNKVEHDNDRAESVVSSNPTLSSTESPSQISSSNPSPNECSVQSPALSTQLDSPSVSESKSDKKKDHKVSLSKKDSDETTKPDQARDRKDNCTSSSPSSQFERMRLGMKVLAKWKDKNFYPAEVMKQLSGNKWSVKFDDSQTKNVFENEVVRLEYLSVDQEIMLSTSNDTCVKATIMKIYSKNIKTLEFDLEHFENGKDVMKRYRLSDIFLNADQGAAILNRTGHKKIISKNSSESVFADVDLDNIVSGKRSRSNKVDFQSSKKSNQDSANQQPQQQSVQTQNTSSSESELPARKKRKVAEKSSQKEQTNKSDNNDTNCGKQKHGSVVESKIFQKCSFLIVDINDDCLIADKQFSGGEQMKVSLKEHLTKQILAGQGQVFETFDKMKKATQLKNCYLLSKSYNTSLKYFQCLASGVPIISHLWIIESSRSNKLLDRNSFVLPSGYSLVNNTAITELNLIQASHGLFKDTKVYCKTDIEHQIVDILKASNATVIINDDHENVFKDDKKPDIIIVECCEPSDELVKCANNSNIPILKRDYILQCLINGRKLSFDEQPNFSITL